MVLDTKIFNRLPGTILKYPIPEKKQEKINKFNSHNNPAMNSYNLTNSKLIHGRNLSTISDDISKNKFNSKKKFYRSYINTNNHRILFGKKQRWKNIFAQIDKQKRSYKYGLKELLLIDPKLKLPKKTIEAIRKHIIYIYNQKEYGYKVAKEFKSIVVRYVDRIGKSKFDIGQIPGVEYKIRLKKDAKPFFAKPAQLEKAHEASIKEYIDTLIEYGILSKIESEWGSQAFVVINGDGSTRLVCNYIRINQCTEDLSYPTPSVPDILSEFHGKTIYSQIDITKAFFNIKVEEESRKYTTIVTKWGTYCWNVMPFGGKNCPATWALASDKVFKGCKDVIKYVDDIVIASKRTKKLSEAEQHLKAIEELFLRLKKYNLKIKISKCNFFVRKIKFLGCIITPEGRRPDDEYIRRLLKYKHPTTLKDLRAYCGAIEWISQHVYGLKKFMIPLRPLLKYKRKLSKNKWKNRAYSTSVKLDWKPIHQEAFENLQKIITECTILAHPNFNQKWYLYTDASDKYYSGVLLQKSTKDPTKYVIVDMFSKVFTGAAERDHITSKEIMAIIESIKKWHHYLYGRKFHISTDANNIKHLFNCVKTKKTNNAKHFRWVLLLQEYDFTVQHIPGIENKLADFLSRIDATALENHFQEGERDLRDIQAHKQFLQHVYAHTNQLINDSKKGYAEVNGILYYQDMVNEDYNCKNKLNIKFGNSGKLSTYFQFMIRNINRIYNNTPDNIHRMYTNYRVPQVVRKSKRLRNKVKKNYNVDRILEEKFDAAIYLTDEEEEEKSPIEITKDKSTKTKEEINSKVTEEVVTKVMDSLEDGITDPIEKLEEEITRTDPNAHSYTKTLSKYSKILEEADKLIEDEDNVNVLTNDISEKETKEDSAKTDPRKSNLSTLPSEPDGMSLEINIEPIKKGRQQWTPTTLKEVLKRPYYVKELLKEIGVKRTFSIEGIVHNQKRDPILNIISKYLADNDITEEIKTLTPRLIKDLKDGKFRIGKDNRHNLHVLQQFHQPTSKWLIVLPKYYRAAIIKHLHDGKLAGHGKLPDIKAKILRKGFIWPGYTIDIKDYINSCEVCTRSKPCNKNKGEMKLWKSRQFNECLCIDSMGPMPHSPSGNKYIINMIDRYSGYAVSAPAPTINAFQTVITLIIYWITKFGLPHALLSDNGSEYNNKMVNEICDIFGMKHKLITSYISSTNGTIERFNRTLTLGLRQIAAETNTNFTNEKIANWDLYLSYIAGAHNNKISRRTQCSPNELVFGRNITLPLDIEYRTQLTHEELYQGYINNLKNIQNKIAQTNLNKYDEKRVEEYNKNRHTSHHFINEKVLWYKGKYPPIGRKKYALRWMKDIYKIIDIWNNGNNVTIQNTSNGHIHNTNIKRIISYNDVFERIEREKKELEQRSNKSADITMKSIDTKEIEPKPITIISVSSNPDAEDKVNSTVLDPTIKLSQTDVSMKTAPHISDNSITATVKIPSIPSGNEDKGKVITKSTVFLNKKLLQLHNKKYKSNKMRNRRIQEYLKKLFKIKH